MLSSFWIAISLGEAEIDNINDVLFFAVAYQEVIGFHVPVNEVIIVQEFESLDHLVSDHERRLNCEFTLAEVERVFETRTEQVHDHRIVVALYPKPVNRWYSSCNDQKTLANCIKSKSIHSCLLTASIQNLVDLGLIKQLWEFRLDRFLI